MKRFTLTVCAATLLLFACNNDKKDSKDGGSSDTTSSAGKVEKEEAWVPVDSATAAKAWQEYATPGKIHEMVASWNGNWTADMTHWMADGAPPMKSTGTCVNSMIMGGRYQVGKYTSEMMGMPFEGMSTMGYDNTTKQFVSSWVDNMGTGIMTMKGPWDESAKTITLTGTMADFTRPGKECKMREVFTIIDADNQKMEMYGQDPATGKEYKSMEILFKRKK